MHTLAALFMKRVEMSGCKWGRRLDRRSMM